MDDVTHLEAETSTAGCALLTSECLGESTLYQSHFQTCQLTYGCVSARLFRRLGLCLIMKKTARFTRVAMNALAITVVQSCHLKAVQFTLYSLIHLGCQKYSNNFDNLREFLLFICPKDTPPLIRVKKVSTPSLL